MHAHHRLLATDLDGTVIPPELTPERAAEVEAFASEVGGRDGLALAYVTGRHFEHALEGIERTGLPAPDFLVCEVGTVVRRRDGRGYAVDEDYRAIMDDALGTTGERVRAALASHTAVELQPPAHQGEHKTSFFGPWPVPDDLLSELRRLAAGSGARVDFVVSRDSMSGRGLIDALPHGVAKDRAVRHLAGLLDLGPDQVVFAGDSGNDRAALLAGFNGVVVGNAPDELAADLDAEARRQGTTKRIYFAKAWYAAGVLEGCRHFGLF